MNLHRNLYELTGIWYAYNLGCLFRYVFFEPVARNGVFCQENLKQTQNISKICIKAPIPPTPAPLMPPHISFVECSEELVTTYLILYRFLYDVVFVFMFIYLFVAFICFYKICILKLIHIYNMWRPLYL